MRPTWLLGLTCRTGEDDRGVNHTALNMRGSAGILLWQEVRVDDGGAVIVFGRSSSVTSFHLFVLLIAAWKTPLARLCVIIVKVII